jgi:hypothetical protein
LCGGLLSATDHQAFAARIGSAGKRTPTRPITSPFDRLQTAGHVDFTDFMASCAQ